MSIDPRTQRVCCDAFSWFRFLAEACGADEGGAAANQRTHLRRAHTGMTTVSDLTRTGIDCENPLPLEISRWSGAADLVDTLVA
jgi:hypothetical protein